MLLKRTTLSDFVVGAGQNTLIEVRAKTSVHNLWSRKRDIQKYNETRSGFLSFPTARILNPRSNPRS